MKVYLVAVIKREFIKGTGKILSAKLHKSRVFVEKEEAVSQFRRYCVAAETDPKNYLLFVNREIHYARYGGLGDYPTHTTEIEIKRIEL